MYQPTQGARRQTKPEQYLVPQRTYTFDDLLSLEAWLREKAKGSKISSRAGRLHFAAEIVRDYHDQQVPNVSTK